MSPVSEEFRSVSDIGDILARPGQGGRPMATMRDVALRAGVSAKTVSRVVNNDRYVSADVRTRVERAIEDLQYVPNMLAVTFRTGRDAAIGVAVPGVGDPFFAGVISAVEREASRRGVAVICPSAGRTCPSCGRGRPGRPWCSSTGCPAS